MTIRITAIRLGGGTGHQHITRLWWVEPATGKSDDTERATVVSWLEDKGITAYVEDDYGNRVAVGVVSPPSGPKYLRTHADGKWTDNLLALPQK